MKYLTQLIVGYYPIFGLLFAVCSGSTGPTSTRSTSTTVSSTPFIVGSGACPFDDYTALFGLEDTCLLQESCVCANQATLVKCLHELCTDTFAFGVQAELAERCATFMASDTVAPGQSFTGSHDYMARQMKIAIIVVSIALGVAVLAGAVIFARRLQRRRVSSLVPPVQCTQPSVSHNEIVTTLSSPRQLRSVAESHTRPPHRPTSTLGALSLRGRNGSASSTYSVLTDGDGDVAYTEDADMKCGGDLAAIHPQQVQIAPVSHFTAPHPRAPSRRTLITQRFQGVWAHRGTMHSLDVWAISASPRSEVDTQSNTTSLGPPPAYDELSQHCI
ncbi:hypothetical protein C8Q73DRAFT_710904 [Cubamyces lactineus]|nr:hypothetical protein C8Q73DRAFT_710904 [Cubamyces lactineus]